MVQQAPVGLADVSGFSADPAQVSAIAAVVPDETPRLQLADHVVGRRPLVVCGAVDIAAFIGPSVPAVTAVGSVEPHLKHIAVLCQQFVKLVAEVCDIFRLAIVRMIAVPWREVYGIFQPFLAASLRQLADNIALAVLPRRVLHRILSVFRRPHAEAAVMLCREDDALHAGLFADACPLAAVEVAGIEQRRVFVSVAPLLVGISVKRVVDEGVHLHILPTQLVFSRYRAVWGRSRHLGLRMEGREESQTR